MPRGIADPGTAITVPRANLASGEAGAHAQKARAATVLQMLARADADTGDCADLVAMVRDACGCVASIVDVAAREDERAVRNAMPP